MPSEIKMVTGMVMAATSATRNGISIITTMMTAQMAMSNSLINEKTLSFTTLG